MTQPNAPDAIVVLMQLSSKLDLLMGRLDAIVSVQTPIDVTNLQLAINAIADKLQKISGQSGVFEMRDVEGKMTGTRLAFQGMNVFIINEPDTRVTVDEYQRLSGGGVESRNNCVSISMDRLGDVIREGLWPTTNPAV